MLMNFNWMDTLFIIIIRLLIIPNKVTRRIEFSNWLFKNNYIYFNIKIEIF